MPSPRSFLWIVALAQGVLLTGLIVLLLLNRWFRVRRRARLHPRRVALEESLRHWVAGGEIGPVLTHLARLPTLLSIDALVAWSARVPGERWRDLAGRLASAPWARLVKHDAASARWWRRLEAARLLSVAAVPADGKRVLKLLRDPHPAVHLAAAGALERLETRELVTVALDRLPHLPPTVYAYYAAMLQRSRRLVIELLLERLRRHDDPRLGRFSEFAARMQDPALREALTGLAGHPTAEVRVQVARALGAFPHADSLTVLPRLAGDATWEVRAQAVRSLGRIGDAGSLQILKDALRDREWWVRLRGALGLHRLGALGRNALLAAEVGADPLARDMARLVLGLTPQALAEFAA